MTIKTIEEYRRFISKQPQKPSTGQGADDKYFFAGFIGAAIAARKSEKKHSKNPQPQKK